jgi:DNA polymerase III subunit beta
MEIKIKKSEFLKGLYLAQSIADRKSTMPVLANALIRSEGKDSILCAATDLRVSVVAEMKADIIKEGGLSIVAKHLFEIVRGLPGEDVHFKKTDNNWAEIKAGKAQYKVVGMSDRDFPRLPDHHAVEFKEIDAATLSDMIDKTIFSVSSDETRRHLSGIYMEWEGGLLRMVSTDGHRLSKVEVEVGPGLKLDAGVIIPRKGVLEMRRLLEGVEGTCDLGLHEGNLFVRAKDLTLTIKLVDAQFPPYSQVIPKENEKRAHVDRNLLLDSLKRMSIMSTERSGGIRFDLSKGQLRITSDNPDLGEAQEDIDVEYEGESLTIGFNPRYFIDLLNEMGGEKVFLEFNGELDPGLVRADEGKFYLGVIMPMRI